MGSCFHECPFDPDLDDYVSVSIEDVNNVTWKELLASLYPKIAWGNVKANSKLVFCTTSSAAIVWYKVFNLTYKNLNRLEFQRITTPNDASVGWTFIIEALKIGNLDSYISYDGYQLSTLSASYNTHIYYTDSHPDYTGEIRLYY